MNKNIIFPKINTTKTKKDFFATSALKLKSMLKGDLLYPQIDKEDRRRFDPFDKKKQHHDREAILVALSSWPSEVTIELHFTALPDLMYRAQSELLISLFLHVSAHTETDAKEHLMTRYLSLVPLLAAYLPEAEFVPVTNDNDLALRMNPFTTTHAISIERREEEVNLATPLRRTSIGFDALQDMDESKNHRITHRYAWVPSFDDWSRLLNTLTGLLDPTQLIIRIQPSQIQNVDYIDQLDKSIKACEDFLSREKLAQITFNRQTSLLRDVILNKLSAISDRSFNAGVFLLAPYPIDESIANVIGQSVTANHGEHDEAGIFEGGFTVKEIPVRDAKNSFFFSEQAPFSVHEAACAFRLPSPPAYDIHGLTIKRARTTLANFRTKRQKSANEIQLFQNEHRGIVQPVMLNTNDRMLHTFIAGQTGTGKSMLMEKMILQDIRDGRGVAVIEPHTDLLNSLLGKIPEERIDDVILFDVLDRQRPLGFNMLQWNTIEERDLIIDELYLTLDHLYDMDKTGGPIFETNFRGMLKLLMGDKKRGDFIPTLLDFMACYQDDDFRKWLTCGITDPTILDFVKELERSGGEVSLRNLSPYVTSKFSRFINDTALQRIIGQEESSFNFEDIMNKNKIFLVNLGKGRFGSTVSALIANQLVSRFKLAAMKRGDMRPEERKDFFLYVDECHNLPAENFMSLVSEARKFRMGCVLTTQYTSQIADYGKSRNSLLAAILGNVGTIIMFRLGKEDADRMAPVLYPVFEAQDIVGLPNFQGYAKMQQVGAAIEPFSFRTEIEKTPYSVKVADRVRTSSRYAYGSEAAIVDSKIRLRRTMWQKDNDAPQDDEKDD